MRTATIIAIIVGVLVSVALGTSRAKRRWAREVPEINKHPERLDQMLDPTDDA